MLQAVISVSILSPPDSLDASRTHFCLSSPSLGHVLGHPGMKDRRLSSGHVIGPASLFICALSYNGSCSDACHQLPSPFSGIRWWDSSYVEAFQNLELTHLVTATWTDTKTRVSLNTCH